MTVGGKASPAGEACEGGRRGASPANLPAPTREWAGTFQERLLHWYGGRRRELPWRENRDPYRIWVSEAMLQQTRVETVVPYFLRFVEQFPTVEALAAAPEEQVLKAWEGLGYYSRARRLQASAREVQARYGGLIPRDPAAFGALPGVGRYTVGAVLSIAYDLPLPAVDGNVVRVLSRLLLMRESPETPAARTAFEATAQDLIPLGQAGDFNQAMMELGALVCLPRAPRCGECPVAGLCRARASGEQEELPLKAPRRAVPTARLAVLVPWRAGSVLVRQRPDTGLLAGLWEFPNWLAEPGETPQDALRRGLTDMGLSEELDMVEPLLRVQHAFSHLRWDLRAYLRRLAPGEEVDPAFGRWVDGEGLAGLPLPVPMGKVRAALGSGGPQPGLQKRLDGLDTVW